MDEGSETTASSGAASLAWATQISHYKNYRRPHKPRVHGWLDFATPKPLLHDVERRGFRQESPTGIGVSQPQFATTKGTIAAQPLDIFGDLQTTKKSPSVVVP
jgi:hypothetical protein